ncbi:pre-toxin TG domain-containing protein [Bacillus altitudinis]|nr:pre-toxin TG domain-containing protein [Bacillus altitudinis]MCY7579344.1 pre-toxin TG domain-containing protein [Bacillus altitudinis]WJE31530.1 pre-toxin TG domain-containing protein [Bacillus altitudinis]
MKEYIDTLGKMFTGPKIGITSYQKDSILKDEEDKKISSTISGLNKKIDNPDENPMMVMLKKLNEKEHSNVDTVVNRKPSNKINQNAVFVNGKVYNTNEKIDFANAKTVEVIRDGMLYRLRISDQNKVNIESITKISDLKTGEQTSNILNTAVEFTGINDAIRVITGRDPVTGDKVAEMDRLVSSLYMIPGAKIAKVGKYLFKMLKGEKTAKKIKNTAKSTVKPVSNMNEFFDMSFGKSISNSLTKTKVKYDGQSIYKVDKRTDNQYLKKGYGLYLDALHKDHLEIIDKTGNVKYVLNLDGTLNTDKTKKALGRFVKGYK